ISSLSNSVVDDRLPCNCAIGLIGQRPMTKPFSRLCSIPQRHLLPLTLLTCALTTGCQTPGFGTALSGKKADAQAVASTTPTGSGEAGLPEPTNTATSNSPLSLSSIDEHLRLGEQE